MLAIIAVIVLTAIVLYTAPRMTAARDASFGDEVQRVAVTAFAWTGGVALVLAAVYFFSSDTASIAAAAAAIIAGILLLLVSHFLVVSYPVLADVLAGAAVGILYAAFYAMHVRWALVGLGAMIAGVVAVSAVAIVVAVNRRSTFVAVAALLGGYVTPAWFWSSDASRYIALFSYLAVVTASLGWLAQRRRWPALAALAVTLSTLYVWLWVLLQQSPTESQITLALVAFAEFALVGTLPLWSSRREEGEVPFEWTAIAAAHLPLLFAVYAAWQVNYAPQFSLLFGYLLVVDAQLLALGWRMSRNGAAARAPRWFPAVSALLTLAAVAVWFRFSYADAAWPSLLVWAVLFIALYLVRPTIFTALMFGFFIGLGVHATTHWAAIAATMFLSLAVVFYVAMRRNAWIVAALAIAVSSAALMTLHPPLTTLIALHAILFAEIFVVAWIAGRHVLAVLAVPFFVAMIITAYAPPAPVLWIAAVPYLLFAAYPIVLCARAQASLAPYIAAALATLVVFIVAWPANSGWVALAATFIMGAALLRTIGFEPREPRFTLLFALALGLSDVAAALLLPAAWAVVYFAAAVVFCVWLFTRIHHPLLVLWATGLAALVFGWLAFDSAFFTRWYVYFVCGLLMFAAAYLIRLELPIPQRVYSVACLFELWFMINLLVAAWFHSSNGAVTFDFAVSQPSENAVYTGAWAIIATGLLALGYWIRWPAARGAAMALLIASVLKAFLSDLPYVPVPYLTFALVALGISVAIVAIVLQRRWVGWSLGLDR